MKLSELREIKSAEAPVVGEIYTVKGFTLDMIEDTMNPGKTRPLVKLDTDKGVIFAPNTLAKAIKESADAGEDVEAQVIGQSFKCKEFFSKRWQKKITTFEYVE